eukprot:g2412.t1
MATTHSLADFVRAHKAQLSSIGLPEMLWPSLLDQLQQQQLSYDGLQLARVEDADADADGDAPSSLAVVAARDLSPTGDVFLLDHAWTFFSLADAEAALAQVPGLAARVLEIMTHAAPPQDEAPESTVARVLALLPDHAGMYKVATQAAAGATHGARSVFYLLDEVGGRIGREEDAPAAACNLHVQPFMRLDGDRKGLAYCVAWPRTDISAGDIVYRAAGNRASVEGALDALRPWAPVALVTVECTYLRRRVLDALAARPRWRVFAAADAAVAAAAARAAGAGPAAFHWGEYEHLDWPRVDAGAIQASCYCTRRGLIRKANLAHNVRKWAAKHPGSALAAAAPETHVMEVDAVHDPAALERAVDALPLGLFEPESAPATAVAAAAAAAPAWILKPSITNQARGIAIVRSRGELLRALHETADMREWVLQRYLHRPLLVDGRKFHLRVYVLVVGSIAVHVYPEYLALFALDKYAFDGGGGEGEGQSCAPAEAAAAGVGAEAGAASADTTGAGRGRALNMRAHLTNTCAQGPLDATQEERAVRLWSELRADFERDGVEAAEDKMRAVERAVRAVVGESLQAVHSELTFQTHANCFEHFGFDLMVDDQWHVWLLEANAEPDFKQTGSRLETLVRGVVEETLALTLDVWNAERLGEGGGAGGAGEDAYSDARVPPDAPGADLPAGGVPAAKFDKVFEREPRPW